MKKVIITRDMVKGILLQYMNRDITLGNLVDWSDKAVCDNEFEDSQAIEIRDILGQIRLADVREFGLLWDDCYGYLKRLGYRVNVEATKLPT